MLLPLLLALSPAFAQAAPPPVPGIVGPAPVVYDYQGASGEGRYPTEEILALIRQSPGGTHMVRGGDATQWTEWNHVPALAMAWLEPRTPPNYVYWGGEGDPVTLGTAEVVARVRAAPEGTHLVWRPGLDTWVEAKALPSLGAPLAGPASTAPPAVATQPAPPAPVSPPPPPTPPPPLPSAFRATVGADVRVGLAVDNLERFGNTEVLPTAGFSVSRARPVLDVALGEAFSGRLSAELAQDAGTTLYSDTGISFEVANWANGWSITGREIYLEAHGGKNVHNRVRVGLQEPAFGVRDRYEDDYPFAGAAQRLDLARRTGLLPDEDLGVGWRGDIADKVGLDVQVLNGTGGLDENTGKDLIGRLEVTPVKAVRIGASGLWGARDEKSEGQQLQGELSVELRGPSQRVALEVLAGATTEDRLDTIYSGAAATGAWDIAIENSLVEGVTLVARAHYYDPVLGLDAPDGWWASAGGAWVRWRAFPGHEVRTGATWESYVPQNLDNPVEHHLVAEAAWRF